MHAVKLPCGGGGGEGGDEGGGGGEGGAQRGSGEEQSSPVQQASHSHSPPTHRPCPEHWHLHSFQSHSGQVPGRHMASQQSCGHLRSTERRGARTHGV